MTTIRFGFAAFAVSIALATAASSTKFNESAYCEQLGGLAKGKQIALPVDQAQLTKIYKGTGLESRLESQMFKTMVTGEGELADINGWLEQTCGLTLTN